MSDHKDEYAPQPSEEEGGILDQSELDALIARITGADTDAEPLDSGEALFESGLEPSHATEHLGTDSDELLNQDELDALIDSQSEARAPSADARSDDMLLTQEELDNLLATSGQDREEPVGNGLNQEELDAIIASTQEGTPSSAAQRDETESLLEQDELDALYAAHEHESEELPAETEPSDGPTEPPQQPDAIETARPSPSAEADTLSQEELDALLAGAGFGNETADPPPPSDAISETPEGLLDQSELDALIARTLGDLNDEPSEVADGTDEEAEPSAATEARPENWEPESAQQLTDEELDAALDGNDSEVSLAQTNPDGEITPAPEEPQDASLLDSMLADALANEKESAPTPEAPPPGPPSSPEPKPEPVSKAGRAELDIDEILASLQSAAVQEAEPPPAHAEAKEPEELEPAAASPSEASQEKTPQEPYKVTVIDDLKTAAPPPPKPPRKPLLPPGMMGDAAKWITSLAAGVLVALGVYHGLNNLGARRPDVSNIREARTDGLPEAVARARTLVDAGQYQEAVQTLDRAIPGAPSGHPDRGDAEYLRLEAHVAALPQRGTTGDLETVQAQIEQVIAEHPGHFRAPEAVAWKARLYERGGMGLLAYNAYKRLLTDYVEIPQEADTLLQAARMAQDLGRALEAEDFARRVIQEYPTSGAAGAARVILGDALLAQGQQESATELFEHLAATQPDTQLGALATARLGRIALEEGRTEDAITLFDNRLETATTIEGNDEIYLMLARAHRDAGHIEEAEQTLRELIDFFPESPATRQAHIELSRILDEQGRRDDALRLASHAAQRFPGDPEVMQNLARFLEQTQSWSGAGEALMAADAAGAADPGLLLDAARNFHRAGQYDRALERYDQLLVEHPASPEAFEGGIERARTLYRQGRVRTALEELAELAAFAEGQPRRLPVMRALGELYQELGFHNLASNVYEQVAVQATDSETLAQAAIALLRNQSWEQGTTVANRVDPNALPDELAYTFLKEHGRALMRADAGRGIELMERAYEMYPDHRQRAYDQALLEAYLATDRVARARALVTDLERHVRAYPADTPRFIRAALTWADYLYDRGDYRAAADAYALAERFSDPTDDDGRWATFQRAGALLRSGDFESSLPLFEAIAESESPWASHAQVKARLAQAELTMRDRPRLSRAATGVE